MAGNFFRWARQTCGDAGNSEHVVVVITESPGYSKELVDLSPRPQLDDYELAGFTLPQADDDPFTISYRQRRDGEIRRVVIASTFVREPDVNLWITRTAREGKLYDHADRWLRGYICHRDEGFGALLEVLTISTGDDLADLRGERPGREWCITDYE